MAFTQPGPDRMDVQILKGLQVLVQSRNPAIDLSDAFSDAVRQLGESGPISALRAARIFSISPNPAELNHVPPDKLRLVLLNIWDNAMEPQIPNPDDKHAKAPSYEERTWHTLKDGLTSLGFITPG